jgi:steroid delta-isomerase-like uncharacterized protein
LPSPASPSTDSTPPRPDAITSATTSLALARSRDGLANRRLSPVGPAYARRGTQKIRRLSDAAAAGVIDTAPMPVADTAREFVLTLRHTEDGGPCGTLRFTGRPGETAFEGWIELIGLITEAKGATMDNATTMRSAYERISAGDIPGFGELVADDFVEHDEIPGLPPTKEGLLEYFGLLLAAFPDLRMDVEDLLADGDKTVARVTITATHQGEFMGLPATGTRATIQLIDIMRFDDDGRVGEHWGVADMLSLMQQLGAVPA